MTRELSTTEKAEAYDRLVKEIGYRRPSIQLITGKTPGPDAPFWKQPPEYQLFWAFDKAIDRLKRAKLN